jgi:O-antigen ligase
LGIGTNSIFSSPLDFLLIAGIPGLIFWAVFFCGIGLRSIVLLAPIAAWSLLNPLHQSEIVYLFMGILVTWGMRNVARETLSVEGSEE